MMVLQAPFILWWFLPIALFIILIYLLKIRRKEVKVPAVFLFPKVTTDVRANAPWQRLRFNWLMILQLLAALLLLTALARPMARSWGLIGKTVVFVLDASASMKARDVHPNRFFHAKQWIYRQLNTLRADDQAALIVAMTEPHVAAPLGTNHQKIRQILDGLSAVDAPADVGAAMRLAANIVANRRNACIALVSDGSFGEIADFSPGKAEVIYNAIGKSDQNAGFISLDAQHHDGELRLFVAIHNFGKNLMKGVLSWHADGRLVNARELRLPPKKTHGEMLKLSATVGQVTVNWECNDDMLPSDDVVYWVGGGVQPIRILLVSSGNFFLEKALSLEHGVAVDKIPKLPEKVGENFDRAGNRYDIVIFDGVTPQPVEAKAIWLIGVADGNFVRHVGQVKNPVVTAWDRGHPVLRYVDAGAMLIDSALKVSVADWGQAIVESRATPLVVVGEHGNKRWLFVGFNLLNSDFPIRVGFPIFVANAIKWSIGQQQWGRNFTAKAGMPISLILPAKIATLWHPSGKRQQFTVADQLLTMRDLDEVGIYRLEAGKAKINFAINLLNAEESNIAPKNIVTLGNRAYARERITTAWKQLWWFAILLALIVLVAEWVFYAKKS